ncbi:glucose 1,6-bisphosphate synthase [Scaptodrosophila lebanonensis]|uniref:Glucose 1,6-bisphosphate synthase n=1 Tax=Drosophila lebanonensis TaxID=7225 RepID=A0A6J2TBX8_DROLE|nr:glucose 1,6-bisphosphate synthase [Scaptodrosophila lebanonensis]
MCSTNTSLLCEIKNMKLSGDPELDQQIRNWIKWDRNETTRNQIMNAVRCEDWNTLRARLLNRIEFGTAGLRACMRAGFDSMNELVVVQSAQGLCAYIKEQVPEESEWGDKGIVIGYDGRHNSKRYAELTAIIFLNNKFRVQLYTRFVATPLVPFTILRLKCLAGVMVTASHNPKEDNGYKVYWSNGAQIIPPHDAGIQESIMKNLEPNGDAWDESALCANDMLNDPYESVVPFYYDALKKLIPCSMMEQNGKCSLTFTYTAMHGVGYPYVQRAFDTINIKQPVPVTEQVEPDPNFSTVKFPNPEEGKTSLELAFKRANMCNTPIILANDPDADRLAVAEIDREKKWKIFTGNELGALLGWWALENYKFREPEGDISNCVMIASTVSSKILRAMGEQEGFTFYETLTGFKWMGNKAIEAQAEGKTVLFAFEEAIGFMVSTNVVDKDGVSAAAHVATMACYLRSKKCMSLQEKLRDIYETYGFHTSVCSYVICKDPELIKTIFTRLRTFDEGQENTYPKSILNGEFEIEHVRDLTTGYDSSTSDQKATLPVNENAQMITFIFKNGLVVTLRTSGTEPKMKYYAEMCGKPDDKNWDKLSTTLKRMVEAIVDEFYEPKKNGLQMRAD